jgi:CelD/BcsL family acetyltransferase involved in cellulose biosynthesis
MRAAAAADSPYADAPQVEADVVHGGVEAIDALSAEWSALCDRAEVDEPFYRPEWIRAYVAAFEQSSALALVTARRRGRLVAILPLVSELGTLAGLPARKLRSAGNTHTCRYDLLCARGMAAEAASAVASALLRSPGWDLIELENVPRGGTLARLVAEAGRAGWRIHAAPSLTPPYLDLAPCDGSLDRLLDKLDAKFRSNLRRRMRKLAAHGTVALVSSAEAGALLERFYALERAGWKGAQGSAIDCGGMTRAFYDALARAAHAGGYLALYGLEAGGRMAAIFLGLFYRGRYYLLKTAYDEALRDCSPGQVLTREALGDLLARGCAEFDFLGGSMEWKAEWGPALRPLDDLYIFRGTTGRALHAVRFVLRPAVASAVRRMRGA